MKIVDAHCDTMMLVDEGKSTLVNRHNMTVRDCQLQLMALFCDRNDSEQESYETMERYYASFLKAVEAEKDRIVQVRTYDDIERAFASGRHAALLSTEGGLAYQNDPALLRRAYDRGVRVVGMAWLCNGMVKSNRVAPVEDTGLSDKGRAFMKEGNRLGIIFDASHLSDRSFWDSVALCEKPLIASHSNFRTLCHNNRNLTDDMAKEIVGRGGFIGLNLYPLFLSDNKAEQTVATYLRHIEYGLTHFGEDHIGFGCDIDGCSGHYPLPLDETRSIHDRLIDEMLCLGYPEPLIRKVSGENLLTYFKQYL